MAMLSQEVNRFLGSALLDPMFTKRLFSSERAGALQGFNFQPSERKTILTSQACTLQELSRELTAVCAIQDAAAECDAAVDRFYQSVHPGAKRAPIHMDVVAQRIISSLTSHQVAEGVPAEKYAKFQIAS